MKTNYTLVLLLISLTFFSCKHKPAKPSVINAIPDIAQSHPAPHEALYRYDSPPYHLFHCLDYGMPREEVVPVLMEAAKNGDGEAMACLWNRLFFRATSLEYADPELAYQIYQTAKKKHPAMRVAEDAVGGEESKLATIKKCLEAGPFDAKAFLKKYRIKDNDDKDGFSIWEAAREASIGREFGKPDPKLVFQLVCRGGSFCGDLSSAVDSTYYNWKHNRVVRFNPENYINYICSTGPAQGLNITLSTRGADTDQVWHVRTLKPALNNGGGQHLDSAISVANDFIEANLSLKFSGAYGGGFLWSLSDQKTQYLDMIDRINRGIMPQPFPGDESSAGRLAKAYNAILMTYRKSSSVMSGRFEDEQKAWIRYRDSTARLLGIIWPEVSENSWRNWLTEVRIEELQEKRDCCF